MGVKKNREKGVKKAKYGEFLKLNMGKNTILNFSPLIMIITLIILIRNGYNSNGKLFLLNE